MGKEEVHARRTQVAKLMAKSVTKAEDIARLGKMNIKDVNNDLTFLRKASEKWLYGFANEGYVFVTKQTIDSLYDIEMELQQLRQSADGIDDKLKVLKELRDTINTRWVIQGEGPTLMQLRKTESG